MCVFCGAPFADETNAHVCSKCGGPQPVSPRQDYFTLLGVKRGFVQNLPDLESRFYAISRALHPDRFAAGSDSKWKVISVERMSAVNRAYQTLTKADRLREYLLELEGVTAGEKKSVIPAELAEEWFELQDAVMENPESAAVKLDMFERDLKRLSMELAERIVAHHLHQVGGELAVELQGRGGVPLPGKRVIEEVVPVGVGRVIGVLAVEGAADAVDAGERGGGSGAG